MGNKEEKNNTVPNGSMEITGRRHKSARPGRISYVPISDEDLAPYEPPVRKKHKGLKITGIAVAMVIVSAGAAYAGMSYYYSDKFFEGTSINGIDCSGKTAYEAEQKIAKTVENYSIEVDSRNLDPQTISGDQIGYSYVSDGSVLKLLKGQKDFASNKDYMDLAAKCQISKSSLVEYPLEKITHVFFHTLIKDTSKAFDGDSDSDGYNQYMTTIDEFNKIIQSMYDKGYVMVSPHDMAIVNEDGTMSRGSIMLPPGKIPFVLSQDDVSYYHYMDGDGYASRLVLDENGDVKTEYIEDDGSVSVGDYDMVPLLDTFIKEHPDFSYHGRKGILAMTGYDGVLGYRTDIAYKDKENLQDDQKAFLDSHPDFDYDQDVKDAKKVADAMKAEGWEFASHTWGHRNATTSTAEELEADIIRESDDRTGEKAFGTADRVGERMADRMKDRTDLLPDKWKITFADSCSYPEFKETIPTEKLDLISSITGFENKSGTVRYEGTIQLKNTDTERSVQLDLGNAYETAEVFANGHSAGVRICRPYQFDLTGLLREGENQLAVEVTNTLGTQMRDAISHYLPIEPFGVEGMVHLYIEE